MSDSRPLNQLNIPPGFSRDGTILDRNSYIDGQWVRFQRNRPRKMGGYKELSTNDSIVRGAFAFARDGIVYLYGFGKNNSFITTTTDFASTGITASANLPGLAATDSFSFQATSMFDSTGGGSQKIIVHPSMNLLDISNAVDTNIYIADLGVNPPTWSKLQDGSGGEVMVSGGVVALQPFLFYYGNDGFIGNSNQNKPNDSVIGPGNAANQVNVAGTKIVKGLPLRGSGGSTAGLFWSLDSLIRAYFVGGSVGFKYETLSSQTSILSPQSVIEYDGSYYWIGIDRFLMYNGTVKEVPNDQNYNWFFDNVNFTQRSKVWAIKVPRFGEIWWFFPFGDSDECTHAIIYNVRGNFWYDVQLARSAGFFSQVFRYPSMYGNVLTPSGKYQVFAHEFGVNAIEHGSERAIQSYFETSDFGYPTGGADGEKPVGQDYWTILERLEPDFVQTGDMTVKVLGEEFARGDTLESEAFVFDENTGKVDMREQRRQIRLRFESNVYGGNYQMGRVVIHTKLGDIRS